MFLEVDAGFEDGNSFGFEEFFLQRGVRFADEDFAVGTEDTVPRDSFARGVAPMARPAVRAPPGRRKAQREPHMLEPVRGEFVSRACRRDRKTR